MLRGFVQLAQQVIERDGSSPERQYVTKGKRSVDSWCTNRAPDFQQMRSRDCMNNAGPMTV